MCKLDSSSLLYLQKGWSNTRLNAMVWLFLYLDVVWEGEMSGVRGGKG